MHRLGPRSKSGLLQLDEIADLGALADGHIGPQVCERADPRIVCQRGVVDEAVVENDDPVPKSRVDDSDAAVNLAARADRRLPFERDAGMKNRVGPDLDVGIDVCR
jgi:hypothetical protein